MSLMSVYFDTTLMNCNAVLSHYYNPRSEYMNGDTLMTDLTVDQEFIDDEDISHFMSSYNSGDEETLDSSYYSSEDFGCSYSDCSLIPEDSNDFFAEHNDTKALSLFLQSTKIQLPPEQVAFQIRRNEELARLLSPIRKCQEQIQGQQTRKNAENAKRKFSLTNGIRPKQRHPSPKTAEKPTKLSASVRRWQSEILSKLPPQQQCGQTSAPNVNAPNQWQEQKDCLLPVPPQRRSSLQSVHEWKQEDYYCNSQ